MEIINSIEKEILNTSFDTSIDYLEIGIDELISTEALQEIQIVKSLVSIGKIGFAFKEKLFVKYFLGFLKEFHSGDINETHLAEFKFRFETEKEYKTDVTELLIKVIDNLNDKRKVTILSNLFKAHINRCISWKHLLSLSQSLSMLNSIGLDEIGHLASLHLSDREITIGEAESIPYLIATGLGTLSKGVFQLTSLGNQFYNHGVIDQD